MVRGHAGDDLLDGVLQTSKLFAHLILRRPLCLPVILVWLAPHSIVQDQPILIVEGLKVISDKPSPMFELRDLAIKRL